jgi:hypothetical protein
MVRRLLVLGGASICLALVTSPAAWGSDASTTAAYLRANYALVSAGKAHLGASTAAYRGVLSQVRRDCPRAAAESPQNPESTELSNEVIGAMVLAAGKPDRPAIKTFLRAASGLRWSSASVTRAVARYVTMLGKLYGLSSPDLCGDIHKWAGSGFKSLPASTLAFDKVFYPNWVALGLVPAGIARFESGEGRELARRSGKLEYQLTNAEAQAVETWGDIMNELLLNP